MLFRLICLLVSLCFVSSIACSAPQTNAVGGVEPSAAVAALDVAEGLTATVFAAEPMLLSPSDIDVDHLGRVWVCEVVNYRGRNGERPEGDRILVLEDTDHDGKADKSTVFYQGRDIDSALGICVLGNRVIVSCAPNVFVFTDDNGDLKADRKELLFTKVGQPQHDHSTHAFVFGPDGKLYWNVGNTGKTVHDRDGNPIVDRAGNTVNDDAKPYRQGMVFRCDMDGKNFEVLGHNFRNNYEVAVDSFGTLWQSDNDDDGNRGVRINYVMEFGNYGYVDEITGAGWRSTRTNMETETPLQHWHLNDPGVVPNLLQTGGGSPTGICVYEGSLLPAVFRNQVIHCDAGPNVCRAYPAKPAGAGYTAEMVNILYGARDNWFRPSDVCVAPDGSLIVADWYDPGVGGHAMRDTDKGRLFRVAPANTPYTAPKYDFTTADGAAEALKSANHEARYLAWNALHKLGLDAEPALLKLYASDNPRYRARALWLLAKLEGLGPTHIATALKDADSDIRITALRAARQQPDDVLPIVAALVRDPSPAVRRECALAIRLNHSERAALLWVELAAQHDGKDRWYLEALGIAAEGQWDRFFDTWLSAVGDKWNTPAGRDIIWRSRAAATSDYLARIIADPNVPTGELLRYYRAFDFQTGPAKNAALTRLAFDSSSGDAVRQNLIAAEALARVPGFDLAQQPQRAATLNRVLDQARGTTQFVSLVDRFKITDRYPELLKLIQTSPDQPAGLDATRLLLAHDRKRVAAALSGDDTPTAVGLARSLGNLGDRSSVAMLVAESTNAKRPRELRQETVRALGKTKNGATRLVELARSKELPEDVKPIAAFAIHASAFDDLKKSAADIFPLPPARNDKPLPPLAQLIKSKGDASRGRKVFAEVGTCAKCHVVASEGKEVGPNLSEIGSKLSREAMFESILFPSAGVSHNYEAYAVVLNDGTSLVGLIPTQTPDEISLKGADAVVRTIKRTDIEELIKQPLSLMPADLQKVMTAEELVDVVEFMQTLKKK